MLVYVATKNAGKLAELRALFGARGWRLETYLNYCDVPEGETSYAVNAATKAAVLQAQCAASGIAAGTLGDDSGLEVSALGGRPGVLSARYGGAGATWSERRRQLLAELAATGSLDRAARFVCALHFIDAAGRHVSVERDVAGTIAPAEAGNAGFSYDPIFFYEPSRKTFAEMTDVEKNGVSHRSRAVSALVELAGGGTASGPEKGRVAGNRRR